MLWMHQFDLLSPTGLTQWPHGCRLIMLIASTFLVASNLIPSFSMFPQVQLCLLSWFVAALWTVAHAPHIVSCVCFSASFLIGCPMHQLCIAQSIVQCSNRANTGAVPTRCGNFLALLEQLKSAQTNFVGVCAKNDQSVSAS